MASYLPDEETKSEKVTSEVTKFEDTKSEETKGELVVLKPASGKGKQYTERDMKSAEKKVLEKSVIAKEA